MVDEVEGRPLYDFAYVHDINARLQELASLAEEEKWSYNNIESEHPNPILYYYFHYTFERVKSQNKRIWPIGSCRFEQSDGYSGLVLCKIR
ncbi:MAG: DUF3825 domain-containing protein [Planctomycetota bacterium]